jgi:hypothetical protein
MHVVNYKLFWSKKLSGRNHLGDSLGMDLRGMEARVWSVSIWFGSGSRGEFL